MTRVIADRRSRADGRGYPWLLVAGLVNAGFAFAWARGRGFDRSTWDITVVWVLGLALVMGAALAGRHPGRRTAEVVRSLRHPPAATLVGTVVVLVALVARLAWLDRFPSVVDSDEGFFLLTGREARRGRLPNPYGTSFMSVPDLYRAWQGIVSRPFADTIASYRLLGAVLGAVCVFTTWRVGRRLLGERAGLAAAAILALLPFHLWASRNGLNNIVNTVTLSVAVLFMARTMEGRRRFDATVVGLALGFGLYGYYPAAVFPGVLLLWAVVAVVMARARPNWHAVRLGGWAMAGLFAAAAPILGHYAWRPSEFYSRFNQVTPDSTMPTIGQRLAHLPQGLLYPMRGQTDGVNSGFYRQGPPFLGWPVAVLVAIGFGLWIGWTVQALLHRGTPRYRPEGLLTVALVLSAGISQTVGMASQRYVAIIFVWALAAGTAVAAATAVMGRVVARPWPTAVAAVGLIALAGWHAQYWFDEERQLVAYGDVRTSAAYDLGWRAARMDRGLKVRLEGGPYLDSQGFGNFRLLAPGTEALVSDHGPFELGPDGRPVAPELRRSEVLVLVVERDDAERCALRDRYPEALVFEAQNPQGVVLYATYVLPASAGLPRAVSPARTTLVRADPSMVGHRPVVCP